MAERAPQEMNPWRLALELGGLIAGGLLMTQSYEHFDEHVTRLSETKHIVAILEDPNHTLTDVETVAQKLQTASGDDLLAMAREQKSHAQKTLDDDGFRIDGGLIISGVAFVSLAFHADRSRQ